MVLIKYINKIIMSEKFKYAPGKPGYGTKGDKGSDGQQGLAMYFTDINPITIVR